MEAEDAIQAFEMAQQEKLLLPNLKPEFIPQTPSGEGREPCPTNWMVTSLFSIVVWLCTILFHFQTSWPQEFLCNICWPELLVLELPQKSCVSSDLAYNMFKENDHLLEIN